MQGLISSVGSLDTGGGGGGGSNVFHRKILTSTESWTTEETIAATIYVIGAGGGGGGTMNTSHTGGGGASGAIRVHSRTLNAGTVIEATCGTGGTGGASSSSAEDGGSGGSTNMKIRYNGTVLEDITSAGGGGGGKSYSSTAGSKGRVNLSPFIASYGVSGDPGNDSMTPACGGVTPFAPYGCGGYSGYFTTSSSSARGKVGENGAVIIEWYS